MPRSDDVLTRPAPPADLRVSYGPGPDHVADVRLPASGVAPLVVVVHGGFWRAAFDRTHTGPQCAALAEAGYAVAAIEYRRTGAGGGWPTTFYDVATAVDTIPDLVARSAPGRVDVATTVLVGHSAGGHLALWAASRHRLPPSSPWHLPRRPHGLHGVVSLAGVCDLAEGFRRGLGDGAVTALTGGGPQEVGGRYAQADPMRLLPSGVPSVLVHGDADSRVPLDLSRRYARAAAEAGDPVRLVRLPGTGHFEVIDPLSAAWPSVLAAVARLAGRR